MCITGFKWNTFNENLGITTLSPNLEAPNYNSSNFKVKPDTWLRTMLVFYSLNARLNHLASNWPEEYWMTELPDYVKQRPLTQLAIPGSHNSFAYNLDVDGELAPDTQESLDDTIKDLVNLIPTVKIVIHNWSKTQQLTFKQQLMAGVRYFDVRVGYHSPSRRLRFLHGLWVGTFI